LLFIHRNDTNGKKIIPFFQTKIAKAISLLFAIAIVCIAVLINLSDMQDVPNLLTGNYKYVEGTPQRIWHQGKNFNEYVQVNGLKIEFP
jgi:hypothetical protein